MIMKLGDYVKYIKENYTGFDKTNRLSEVLVLVVNLKMTFDDEVELTETGLNIDYYDKTTEDVFIE